MFYQGDYLEDATVYIMFNTFTSDDPSASSTITNFINTDVHIHKDDGLTQRNNAAGITVSTDFDGITGSHMIVIDTSDDTVGGFWVTGSDYFVRIEGTTVDAATINAVVGHFSIENRFNEVDMTKILGHLLTNTGTQIADAFQKFFDVAAPTATALSLPDAAPDAAGGLPVSDAGGLDLDVKLANTNEVTAARMAILTDWIDGGRLDLILDIIAADVVNIDGIVPAAAGDNMGTVSSVTGNVDGNVTGSVGSVTGHTAQTGDSFARIGATGSGLTSLALASVLGALNDVAADGDPTDADTAIQYLKQIINTLEGTAGIVSFPAAADPANAVSLAQVIRSIHASVNGITVEKNAAFNNVEFLMVDETDGLTPETGKTVTGQRALDGGAFASVSGSIAEKANGVYTFDAAAADTNGDSGIWRFSSSGCLDTFITFRTTS